MPRNQPPPLEELIDRLAEYAEDYLYNVADQIKERLAGVNPQLPPRGPRPGPGSRPPGRGTGARKRVPASKPAPGPKTRSRTAYMVLGVDPKAEQEVLVAAHRAKVRLYHPDMNKDPKSVAKMEEVNLAWEVLKDPAKRQEYDRRMGL